MVYEVKKCFGGWEAYIYTSKGIIHLMDMTQGFLPGKIQRTLTAMENDHEHNRFGLELSSAYQERVRQRSDAA